MRDFPNVKSLMLAAFILVLGNGVASLLLPARASAEGWGPDVIALIGASHALFFTLACLTVPSLVARVGHIRAFGALGTLIIGAMLLHAIWPNPWGWILVRGMAGFATAGSYMILESWMSEETDSTNRGLVFSIYMTVSMAALAIGPFLVATGDVGGFELFALCALIYAAATLPITLTPARAPAPLTRVTLDLAALYRASPAAFVGSIMTGAIAGAWASLAPVYGLQIGLGTAAVAILLAAANIGSMVFQLPIGRLSDRIDRRIVMVAVGLAGAAMGVIVGVVQPMGWTLAVLMFLFGSALYTTYALNAAHANDWAQGVSFVTVASGLLVLYGGGSTLGPIVAGQVMAVAGPSGLFAFTAFCHLVYAGFALWRITQRADRPVAEQTDFRTLPITRAATPQTFELDARAEEGGADTFEEAESLARVDYEVTGEA